MATLSTAMVGPMDGLGLLNASRVMASCRADGVVLKPDAPLTTVDWCWRQRDPSCLVYSTHSDVAGYGRAHYLFSNELMPFNASLLPAGFPARSAVWHDWYGGGLGAFGDLSDAHQPGVGYEGHMYAVASPMVKGWALLGETTKYVPLSTKRFVGVSFGDDDDDDVDEAWDTVAAAAAAAGAGAAAGDLATTMRVTVDGVAGETIEVCAAYCAKNCAASHAVSLAKTCLDASFDAAHTTQTLAFKRPSAA